MQESQSKGWQGAEIITSATPQKQVITEEESARYHVDEDFAEQLAEAKRITTYHNKEYWVTLDDGSLVHLNYDSRLIYPEKFGDRRDVILEGEAYFMVAHDKSRQFVVHTPQGDVAVHGTEFMVNTHGKINTGKKEMSVVLVKGSLGFIPAGGKETIMLPGQELMMVDSQLSINDVDVTPYIAWNTGNFVFDNCPLEQLLEVLARWYGLKVCFIHDDSRNILFTGILSRYAEAKTSLSSIATVADVDITLEENKIIVK